MVATLMENGARAGASGECRQDLPCESIDRDSLRKADVGGEEKFQVNVAVSDVRLEALIARARQVQTTYFAEDYISRVSKRSGYRLTLFTKLKDDVEILLGYVVYRFKPVALSVVQFAIAEEFHRCGFGKKLIKWLIQHAKKANTEIIALSSLPTSTGFYQHFGFKRVKVKGISGEDYVEGQVYMEYRCRRPQKSSLRLLKPSAEPGTEQSSCTLEPDAEQTSSAPEPETENASSVHEYEPTPSLSLESCDMADDLDAAAVDHQQREDPVISPQGLDCSRPSAMPSSRWSFRLRAQANAVAEAMHECLEDTSQAAHNIVTDHLADDKASTPLACLTRPWSCSPRLRHASDG